MIRPLIIKKYVFLALLEKPSLFVSGARFNHISDWKNVSRLRVFGNFINEHVSRPLSRLSKSILKLDREVNGSNENSGYILGKIDHPNV